VEEQAPHHLRLVVAAVDHSRVQLEQGCDNRVAQTEPLHSIDGCYTPRHHIGVARTQGTGRNVSDCRSDSLPRFLWGATHKLLTGQIFTDDHEDEAGGTELDRAVVVAHCGGVSYRLVDTDRGIADREKICFTVVSSVVVGEELAQRIQH